MYLLNIISKHNKIHPHIVPLLFRFSLSYFLMYSGISLQKCTEKGYIFFNRFNDIIEFCKIKLNKQIMNVFLIVFFLANSEI